MIFILYYLLRKKVAKFFWEVRKKLLLFLLVRIRNHGFLFEGKEK
ncbi:hypothetical protein HMPREF0506_0019 [Lactobacillus crispatus JV-V01]|nr:hypothetical protein HMPREF0506_0019 [Lactobacillus crispatus JV-V01]